MIFLYIIVFLSLKNFSTHRVERGEAKRETSKKSAGSRSIRDPGKKPAPARGNKHQRRGPGRDPKMPSAADARHLLFLFARTELRRRSLKKNFFLSAEGAFDPACPAGQGPPQAPPEGPRRAAGGRPEAPKHLKSRKIENFPSITFRCFFPLITMSLGRCLANPNHGTR